MKTLKTVILLSILFYSFTGFSQIETDTSTLPTAKGSFILGGSSSFGFSATTTEAESDLGNPQNRESKNTSFGLRPKVGYFVINNLAVGVEFSFSTGKTKIDDLNLESTSMSYSFSPFVRYYFTESVIKPFLQGNAGIGFSNQSTKNDLEENESKSSNFNYGLEAGVAYFIRNSASIDIGIGYVSSSSRPRGNNESNFRTNFDGFRLSVGVNIFF